MTIAEEIKAALEAMQGIGTHKQILRKLIANRQARGEKIPKHIEPAIRCTLQRHNRNSPYFRGKDLFRNSDDGLWRLA